MSKKATRTASKKNDSKPELKKVPALKTYPKNWYYLCSFLYLCYCYAAFFPDGPVWGIHFIAYVPVAMKIVLLALGGLLLFPKNQRALYSRIIKALAGFANGEKTHWLSLGVVAAVGFILFHAFTIKTDIYGDSVNMLKWYGDNTQFDWHWITDIFTPHLLDNKEALTVDLHRIIAHVFSIPIASSYAIMSAIFGAIFIFVWLMFVQKVSNGPTRIVLALLGLFSGAIQMFFGHIENYSFGILTSTIFLIALYFYLEEKIGTLPFLLLYLLAFKAHIITVLFVPTLIVALAYHYRAKFPRFQSLLQWRSIFAVIILPAFVLGVALYFFVFHSWNEPYALTAGRQFQETFLPIVSFPAPLDHYSLWSPNHLADLLNLLLLTCAPVVVILLNVLLFNRREVVWSNPRVIIFGLAALFPILFFIAMNPTLSPVRDWDVYTLVFPPLLFFVAILLTQKPLQPYAPAWLAQSLVFGVLFTTALVAVDASPLELKERLQDAGAYTYRTFYSSSSYIEARSLALDNTSTALPVHFAHIVSELATNAPMGNDAELGDIMARLASFYAFIGENDSAIAWAKKAQTTDTSNGAYLSDLAAYYVQSNRLSEASIILRSLLENQPGRMNGDLAYIMSQLGARYKRTGDDTSTLFWAEEAKATDSLNLKYSYDLANYYMQTNHPLQALEVFHSIPPDSISIDALIGESLAAASAFGPDSGLPYLYTAKAKATNNRYVDSLIMEMKEPAH